MNTIYNAKTITLAEINERWLKTDMSEGVEMARTTFYRHKCAIEDIFGIYIDCDKKNGNKYFIGSLLCQAVPSTMVYVGPIPRFR